MKDINKLVVDALEMSKEDMETLGVFQEVITKENRRNIRQQNNNRKC